MDIISRIRSFMEYSRISSSQLADTCNIPRPTISQILNGRSKKISNDLIARLHANYPNLSIMWLMFGEGNMLNDANMQFSEPENEENHIDPAAQSVGTQINFTEFPFDTDIHDSEPEKNNSGGNNLFPDNFNIPPNQNNQKKNINTKMNRVPEGLEDILRISTDTDSHAVSNNIVSGRTISTIMVFYSDNSYEMFTPAK